MSEMVERVADAIEQHIWTESGAAEVKRAMALVIAKTAIAAMREPTGAMCDAAHAGSAPGDANGFYAMWEQAIDEALR